MAVSLDRLAELRARGAERARKFRAEHLGYDKRKGSRHKDRPKGSAADRPFCGCDGEGCGTDDQGRQHYMLFRMGDRELYTGKPLTTRECLRFITEHNPTDILVGFSFGYDITMILRDLDNGRRIKLLEDRPRDKGFTGYTYFHSYGIEYLPKNYIRICRVEESTDADGKLHVKVVKGTTRTIYETFGFFQKSFLRTLKEFHIGQDYLEMIEANKDARAQFTHMTDGIREYCRMECVLLADLMDKFRANCAGANIVPRTWNGAGKLAAALHGREGTPTRAELASIVPKAVEKAGHAAYYGGRFEITRTGPVGKIYEYDINSAYPAAMRDLPCLIHGKWHKIAGETARAAVENGEICVTEVNFRHPETAVLCGLPVRKRDMSLFWPRKGNGIYWSVEIRGAMKLGATCKFGKGWAYIKKCDCKPFEWVEPLYEYRKKIGKKAEGYPIKLAINSLYGKLAQRIGARRWGNFIWAGLITSRTRAMLLDAVAIDPKAIAMLATDGVYSVRPLPGLKIGMALGEWECAEHDKLFIVQPGLYWGCAKPKTRGIPAKFFETRTEEFEQAWRKYANDTHPVEMRDPPIVRVPMSMFIGIKLAQARGKPETAGQWVNVERAINFDWRNKRSDRVVWRGKTAMLSPHDGAPDLHSVVYDDIAEEMKGEIDLMRDAASEQPDHVDMSIPWKD